ncbi:DNA replication and repair protein RecF [Candidatus Hakubella thermalkaliphila]|nr:DNA replication and repair protein RecF [Candidatus Hakubella thermalkaliphila]
MIIQELELIDYRNYSHAHTELDSSLNIIVGGNAVGKTNLLESVRILSLGSSYRASSDREVIRWGCDQAIIHCRIVRRGKSYQMDFQIHRNGQKRIRVNQVERQDHGELEGLVVAVLFSPDDLKIVKEGPEYRRDYIDQVLIQISSKYAYFRKRYLRILTQRNSLLKSLMGERKNLDTLEVWDQHLAEAAAHIYRMREAGIEKIEKLASRRMREISPQENLQISYTPNFELDLSEDGKQVCQAFLQQLKQEREEDIARGITSFGPHRDELVLTVSDIDLRTYGSQGQQRTAALALRMAEIDFLREELEVTPILLLDDVMSELDKERRESLMRLLRDDMQCLLTTTNISYFDPQILTSQTVLEIKNGTIRRGGL